MNISLDAPKYLTKSLNSSTNAKLETYNEELFGGPAASFVYTVLMVLNHIIGPFLLGGIIAYERYDGDPQKRNIINRIQSFGLANIIMSTTIHGLVRVAIEIFGLIYLDVMIWMECLFCIFACNAVLFFVEMSVLQLLYIVVWKRVKTLKDEFWARFLIGTATTVSSWVVLVDHIPARMIITNLMVHTANLQKSFEEIRYHSLFMAKLQIIILVIFQTPNKIFHIWIFINRSKAVGASIFQVIAIVGLTIHLISAIRIAYQKYNYQKEESRVYVIQLPPKSCSNHSAASPNDNIFHSPSANTNRYNPILYQLDTIIYFTIAFTVHFIITLVQKFYTSLLSDYATNFLFGTMINFILPCIFLVRNPKAKTFIVSCFVNR